MSINTKFNQNEGHGGFETGLYDLDAIHPGSLNWTGQSRFSGPDKPIEKWRYEKNNAYIIPCPDCSLAIDQKSNLYIADSTGNMYVFNADNSRITSIFNISSELGWPILCNGNTIYIHTKGALRSKGHKLYKTTLSGEVMKINDINDLVLTSPVLGSNDEVYIVSEGSELRSYNKEGELNWVFKKKFEYWGMPVISSNNIIYIGSGKQLFAIDKHGHELWDLEIGRSVSMSPIINNKGDLLICTNTGTLCNGKLYLINQKGNIIWQYELKEGGFVHNPSFGKNGIIYIAANFFRIFAIELYGNIKHKITTTKGFLTNKIIIDKQGTIYLGLFNNINNKPISWICAFDKNGNEKWIYKFEGSLTSFVLGDDNTMYTLLNTYGKAKRQRNWELHAIGDV